MNGGSFSTVTSGSASGPLWLNVGVNTIDVKVTAQDGTTTATYTITVTRPSETALTALSLSSGTLAPAFDSGTTGYTASVGNATSSLTVTPTAADAAATIEVRVNGGSYSAVTSGSPSGALALDVGANTIDVKVRAAEGLNMTTYTVTVTRAASADATLSALSSSSGTLAPVFDAGTTSYTAAVGNATSSLTATPTATHAGATIEARVNGGSYGAVTSGSPSGALALDVGANTIDVKVTAQDGTTTATYTITVTRAGSADATLSGLFLSSGTLAPAFASGTTSYTASVSNATSSLTVTLTATHVAATIEARVNGGSYGAPGALALDVGANTIDVKVTAQDGTTTATYTVTVTRAAPSADTTLSALSLSSGTLAPSFASGTTTYTASVSNATSSLTVTPTVTDAGATIEARVNGGSYSAVTSGSASSSLPLNVGANTVDVKVTAADTTTTTYTVTVTRAASEEEETPEPPDESGTPAPSNFALPTTTGTTEGGTTAAGTEIGCDPGLWTGATSFTYSWWSDRTPIASATAAAYVPTLSDVGHLLRCAVTGTGPGGETLALSDDILVLAADGAAAVHVAVRLDHVTVRNSRSRFYLALAAVGATHFRLSPDGGETTWQWRRVRPGFSVGTRRTQLWIQAVDPYGRATAWKRFTLRRPT